MNERYIYNTKIEELSVVVWYTIEQEEGDWRKLVLNKVYYKGKDILPVLQNLASLEPPAVNLLYLENKVWEKHNAKDFQVYSEEEKELYS